MKRFWETVTIAPSEAGFAVLLDGKPMHLPGGTVLCVAGERLALAIAEEWRSAGGGKGGEMSFADTPLTGLAGTAQQRIAPDPAPTIDAIARYAESDLLCYRAETPASLVERQDSGWQPWLDWVARTYDAPLRVSTGIAYVKQHRGSIAALRNAVAALDVPALAALGVAVPAQAIWRVIQTGLPPVDLWIDCVQSETIDNSRLPKSEPSTSTAAASSASRW